MLSITHVAEFTKRVLNWLLHKWENFWNCSGKNKKCKRKNLNYRHSQLWTVTVTSQTCHQMARYKNGSVNWTRNRESNCRCWWMRCARFKSGMEHHTIVNSAGCPSPKSTTGGYSSRCRLKVSSNQLSGAISKQMLISSQEGQSQFKRYLKTQ